MFHFKLNFYPELLSRYRKSIWKHSTSIDFLELYRIQLLAGFSQKAIPWKKYGSRTNSMNNLRLVQVLHLAEFMLESIIWTEFFSFLVKGLELEGSYNFIAA